MLAALVLLVTAELAFGISGRMSEALGRGSDLRGEHGSGHASWNCIPIRFSGRDLRASGWEKGQSSWKEFSILSQTRPIMAIWKHI